MPIHVAKPIIVDAENNINTNFNKILKLSVKFELFLKASKISISILYHNQQSNKNIIIPDIIGNVYFTYLIIF
jgi:hypothetical protein